MMDDPVFQLVYQSRATRPLDNVELDRLALSAATFNRQHHVTGLLLYDGSRFIQALEGTHDAVTLAMNRIDVDPLHDSIAYVERRFVARRQFGGWAMDVRRVLDGESAQAFLADLRRTLATVEDHRLVAAFIGFALLGRPELRARRSPPGERERA
ncbi:BLUF domain-containing protein [uncultured Sphingomonas sp.]|uniref:BLUF domain-containing protein n=1 Tax=uncultured Sphingomonas sp. TaxID=158754 RepID=UPI00374858D2